MPGIDARNAGESPEAGPVHCTNAAPGGTSGSGNDASLAAGSECILRLLRPAALSTKARTLVGPLGRTHQDECELRG